MESAARGGNVGLALLRFRVGLPNDERMSLHTLRSLTRRVIPALLVAQAAFLPLQSASAAGHVAHPCRSSAECGSVIVAPRLPGGSGRR